MADVFVAATSGEDAHARGLAEALSALGFALTADIPAEADIAKTVEDAKCVLVTWSAGAPPPPWLAVLATLALERKKLVCAELDPAATPAPFSSAPRVALDVRDRAAFKARFESLVAEVEKLTPTEGDADALPNALALARAALLKPLVGRAGRRWISVGSAIAAIGLVFVVGFGVGRIINAVRNGTLLVAAADAPTVEHSGAREPARTSTPVSHAAAIATPTFGVTRADLETLPWREAAAKIRPGAAQQIKAEAARGDPLAQSIACLANMVGADGFLPSPTAAREHCDAAAAQHYPPALYLSWQLRRTAPHSGIDEATARARLAEAALAGLLNAQVDYAQVLAPDARASLQAQTEAGRLFLAAAERGDPRGQYFYARWLRDSRAGPRDPRAAAPFLERASEHGQLDATHMLATFYRDGIGVPRDLTRARSLYERAAVGNYPASMFNLANMIDDNGVAADRARAVALYRGLACMRDEQQIQPMAVARLRALREPVAACG